MDVPRFTREELTARLVKGELEKAFPRAWLRAEGTVEVVAAIQDWLGHEGNRILPEASFVYCAWLEAGGRFASIRQQVLEWVRANSLEWDARYLLKYVVKQRLLPDDVTLKILRWCSDFANDPDAIWKLSPLSAHIGAELFEDALRTSESVLEPIFANVNLMGVTRSQVTTVLGNLVRLEHLASAPPSRRLDALLCRWMNHPQSFEPTPDHAPYHQTRPILARLLAAAESEPTTPDLWPLVDWIGSWDERTRMDNKDIIKRVRTLRHTSTGGRPRRRA